MSNTIHHVGGCAGDCDEPEAHGVATQGATRPDDFFDIVFDGPPAHVSGRFVESEGSDGKSISVGEWIDRGDGCWALRIKRHLPASDLERRIAAAEKRAEEAERERFRLAAQLAETTTLAEQQAAEIDRLKALVPHTMRLTDTCHGMTGGDLYTCGNCGSYVVVRAEAAAPKCPSRKERE